MNPTFWTKLAPRARAGLAAGALLVLAAMVWLGSWALRIEYAVLFANLAPADAAAMVAEVEKLKLPYRLDGDGNTILVPADQVHKTRLKLVSTELPLHGAVGLELFNNSEIGMTEFAQKINYQRAQQGELTRTIMSIDAIQSARVHLALPEQGLFKKAGSDPKASVALTLRPGMTLQPLQVHGIQRLVAAAIPDIKPHDVTVLDQHGVALSGAGARADAADAGAALDDKRGTELYLTRKLNEVLAGSFGAGIGIASVDVELNRDSSRSTIESVLPAAPGQAAGVLVREKRAVRDGAAAATDANVVHHESEYQVGRRVDQLATASGAIRRISAVVVVRKSLRDEQIERVRDIAVHTLGIDPRRGDAVAVYAIDQVAGVAPAAPAGAPPAAQVAAPAQAPLPAPAARNELVLSSLQGLLLLACAGGAALLWRRRYAAHRPRRLQTEAERAATLAQLQRWLDSEAAAPGSER